MRIAGSRYVVAAVFAASSAGLAVGLPVPGAAAELRAAEAVPAVADLQVLESVGVAAVGGVVSRLPAESAGGAVFTSTVINLDKARGTAAGLTGGDLVEIFMGTSSPDYRNSTLVRSQYPPTAAEKEEGAAEISGADGSTASFTTKSTGQPSSVATAIVRTLSGDGLGVHGGRSASNGALTEDGTLVTDAAADAASIVVGEVVAFTGVKSRAVAKVAPDGKAQAAVETTVAGITVNGVPARLTAAGLELASQPPLGGKELADFNAGLAQLKERGITLAGVPAEVVEEPGRARAVAAVARLRYQVPVVIPNSIGNDEEMILGQVVAESIAKRRPPAGPLPSFDLPAPSPGDGLGTPVPSAATLPVAPPFRSGTVGVLPGTVTAGRLPAAGEGALTGGIPPTAGSPSDSTATPAASDPGATSPDAPGLGQFGLGPASAAAPSDRVRSGYGSFILAALAGAALFLARQRTRLA
jgi:hypothetical protein